MRNRTNWKIVLIIVAAFAVGHVSTARAVDGPSMLSKIADILRDISRSAEKAADREVRVECSCRCPS